MQVTCKLANSLENRWQHLMLNLCYQIGLLAPLMMMISFYLDPLPCILWYRGICFKKKCKKTKSGGVTNMERVVHLFGYLKPTCSGLHLFQLWPTFISLLYLSTPPTPCHASLLSAHAEIPLQTSPLPLQNCTTLASFRYNSYPENTELLKKNYSVSYPFIYHITSTTLRQVNAGSQNNHKYFLLSIYVQTLI